MGSVWKDTRGRSDGKDRYMIGWKDVDGKWIRECVGAVKKGSADGILRQRENDVAERINRGLPPLRQQRKSAVSSTLAEFVEKEYLPAMAPPRRRQTTHERDEQLWRGVKPVLGTLPLRFIGVEHVEKFISDRAHGTTYKGTPPAPATLNRERQFLSQVLGMAKRRRLIPENPVEFVPKLREDNARTRVFSPAEETAILGEAPEFLRPIFTFALNTGMRLGEIVNLKWDAVDRQKGWLYVGSDSKTHAPRQVPINAVVDAILDAQRPAFGKEPSTPHVFVNERFREAYRPSSIYNALKGAAERAKVFGVVFHTARHTFVSRMLEAGVPREKVKLITGHKTDTMVDRYKHLEPDSARGATSVLVSPLFQAKVAKS